jgi:hypothetical protein
MFPHMAYMMKRNVAPLPYLMNSAKIATETELDNKVFLWGWFYAMEVIGFIGHGDPLSSE